MEEQYSIFRKYPYLEQAKELETLLNSNKIETIIADNAPVVDLTFTGGGTQKEIEIRIKQSDFEKAERILEKDAETSINEVDSDHYLFSFTDEELYDILLKPDEWSTFDYTLSKRILNNRGKKIDDSLLNSLKLARENELKKPERNQRPWIIFGYFSALFGGLIGIIIGYILWFSKKTLPNGERVYSYSPSDRNHGKYIFILGLLLAPIVIYLRFA